MADKDLEKRLAALEKAAQESEARAERAEAETKRVKAALKDQQLAYKRDISTVNSMRDLTGDQNYVDDPRAKYDALKAATLKTKDGRAHYFNPDAAAYVDVTGSGRGPFEYFPRESIISIPKDQDPSVTWLATESLGKDPTTGKLVIVPKGLAAGVSEPEDDGSNEPLTNTGINDKASAKRAEMAKRGAGSLPPEATRPSDENVG